ncbi:MAG TPA: NHL repeat-containing protein [Candidatus Acidoferrales bacterium]|nr:NHL repeat-containing protein [Candidatus Acidoferrales bacterium]
MLFANGTCLAYTTPPLYLFQLPLGRVSQFAETSSGIILAPSLEGHVVYLCTETGTVVGQFGAFAGATGVAVDNLGNIYVADQTSNRIDKYGPGLNPINSWGSAGAGPGQMSAPTNLALSPDFSRLYVAELLNSRVSVFKTDGTFLFSFGVPGMASGQFNYPFSIVTDPTTGDLFITNELNNRVDRWSGSGTYISSFGSAGSGPGQFSYPVGIGIEMSTGDLFVTDQLNNRVEKLTQGGAEIYDWGTYGPGNGQFYNPWSVFVTQAGYIWVGDTYNYRVQVFDPSYATPAKTLTWGALKASYR